MKRTAFVSSNSLKRTFHGYSNKARQVVEERGQRAQVGRKVEWVGQVLARE